MVANNVSLLEYCFHVDHKSHDTHSILNHSYEIQKIHHEYAKTSLAYNLPKLINTTSNMIIGKNDTHSCFRFSSYIQTSFITSYIALQTVL